MFVQINKDGFHERWVLYIRKISVSVPEQSIRMFKCCELRHREIILLHTVLSILVCVGSTVGRSGLDKD